MKKFDRVILGTFCLWVLICFLLPIEKNLTIVVIRAVVGTVASFGFVAALVYAKDKE